MSQSNPGDLPTMSTYCFGNHPVRVVMRDDEPWFVTKDVSDALGYRNAPDATRNLADHQKADTQIVRTSSNGTTQARTVSIISESGLYRLVLRSRKPEAERFTDWVTGEVLPQIRKTGSYGAPQVDPERIQLAFRLAANAAAQVEQTVFDAVMRAGPDVWRYGNYLLSFTFDSDNKPTVPWAKALDRNEYVISLDELPERIAGYDALPSTDVQLTSIAHACIEKLRQRTVRRLG